MGTNKIRYHLRDESDKRTGIWGVPLCRPAMALESPVRIAQENGQANCVCCLKWKDLEDNRRHQRRKKGKEK
jgi:hypothetical protein